MRPHNPIGYVISAISIAIAMAGANPAQAQGADEELQYKCFADRADRSQIVFYFYGQASLPSRFSNADTIAQARIPDYLRERISLIHECVLRELAFTSSIANTLETQQPR